MKNCEKKPNVLVIAYQQITDENLKEEFRNRICKAFELKASSFYNYLQGITPLKKIQADNVILIVKKYYPQIYLNENVSEL